MIKLFAGSSLFLNDFIIEMGVTLGAGQVKRNDGSFKEMGREL